MLMLKTRGASVAGDGYVVVGSQDGQIRLYNGKQFTRANTAVPGLGAAITSVDVTYDGKWILATTKSYLMVVKTIYKVNPRLLTAGSGTTGLHTSYLLWLHLLLAACLVGAFQCCGNVH